MLSVCDYSWHENISSYAYSNIPAALIFIGIGLLCGAVLSEKAATAICGALLTNVSAWLSGSWFDLNVVGGTFKKIAYLLPFVHAVDMGKAAAIGDYSNVLPHGGCLIMA